MTEWTFAGCTGLEYVLLSSRITRIGSYCFYHCSQLTNIVIPAGVTEIASNAFSNCHSLRQVYFDGRETTFGENVFEDIRPDLYCYRYSDAYTYAKEQGLPYGVRYSEDLKTLRLPTDLQIIEEEAFLGGTFEAIIVPDHCTSIGKRAFADCLNLVYIRIPRQLTDIAPDAFEGCVELTIEWEEE